MNRYFVIRNRFFSRYVNISSIFVILGFFIFTIALMIFSLLSGDVKITLYDLFIYISTSESKYDLIIDIIRLPRILMAALVGALLGISGLILQTIVRNPLASPDILGISNGASVGVLVFLSYFSFLSIMYLPFAAMIGALITILFIYSFSISKNLEPQKIILIGIAVSLFMGAIATFLFVWGTSATLAAYLWLTGTVYASTWEELKIVSIFTLLILPFLIFLSKDIEYINLSDDSSLSLGVKLFKLRSLLLFISVLFASIAISFAGAISFVGLISPHIAKRLIEHNFLALVVLSALIGAILVLIADLIGRTMFSPLDLPAGIFVSLIGAPFFIYLLIKQFKKV